MKSEDLTKLSRWIIPGWIAILSFFAFVIIDILITPDGYSKIFPSVTEFLEAVPYSTDGIIAALIIAASGVPIGFSIYQAYFFLRWNSPFSKDGFFSPLIPGRVNDMEESLRDITEKELCLKKNWRTKWLENPLFKTDHGFKWRYLELLFTEATQKLDSCFPKVGFYNRHRYLHEVTHTLGASIGAIYVGFLGYLFIKFYVQKVDILIYLLAFFLMTSIFFFTLNIEYRKKKDVFFNSIFNSQKGEWDFITIGFTISNQEINISYPSVFLLFFFFFFHFFRNPIITDESSFSLLIKVIIAFMFIAIWILGKRGKLCEPEKLGDIICLSLISVTNIFFSIISIDLFQTLDWPFLFVVFIFLSSNLVLFTNRQNAKQDMLALEYYVYERFLHEYVEK